MKNRKIGNTDLQVPSVCLGTWVFGGDCWGNPNDAESIKAIEEAIDKGWNFIDTAPIYGTGRSEEVIGKALKGKKDKVIIATKCGLEKHGKGIRPNLTPSFIREEIENSLRRLGVDTIDLYQCHWPDPKTPIEDTFMELNTLKAEGKIKHIGVSNFEPELIEKVLNISEIVSNQVQFSIFDRRQEKDFDGFYKKNNISILSYGSLGGGILTGKYKEPPLVNKGDVKDFFYKYYREPFWSKAKKMVEVFEEIAISRNKPVSHVAINWVRSFPVVASCIAGCRTTQQVDKNYDAISWDLSLEEVSAIQTVYEELFS